MMAEPAAKIARKDHYINLCELHERTRDPLQAVEFCQEFGLVPKYVICLKCGDICSQFSQEIRGKRLGFRFWCQRTSCRKAALTRVSIKKNTWFEHKQLTFEQCLKVIYCFVKKLSCQVAEEETKVGFSSVIEHYKLCREVCHRTLCEEGSIKKIGGPGLTVELDTAKFGSYKVVSVVGGICRETKDKFLTPTQSCEEDTLLDLINHHIEQGSTIITDKRVAHNTEKLEKLGFAHKSLSCNGPGFVDHKTGEHINLMKATWSQVKRSLPDPCALDSNLPFYFAEYIYRSSRPREGLFECFLGDIARLYPGGLGAKGDPVPETSATTTSNDTCVTSTATSSNGTYDTACDDKFEFITV